MSERCAQPEKIKHPSLEAGKAVIADMYRHGKGNPDLNVYQCGDHWHVGHSAVHFTRRIRKALRRNR